LHLTAAGSTLRGTGVKFEGRWSVLFVAHNFYVIRPT
jgi:hypothetical protein